MYHGYVVSESARAVGWTPGCDPAPKAAEDPVQKQLIKYDQHLPEHLIINCAALDQSGSWVSAVNNGKSDNYVPETVPYQLPDEG